MVHEPSVITRYRSVRSVVNGIKDRQVTMIATSRRHPYTAADGSERGPLGAIAPGLPADPRHGPGRRAAGAERADHPEHGPGRTADCEPDPGQPQVPLPA